MFCNQKSDIFYFYRLKGLICKVPKEAQSVDKETFFKEYCKTITKKDKYCGECEHLDNHFIAHHVSDGKLYFRIDNFIYLFSDVEFYYEKKILDRVLRITCEDGRQFILSYRLFKSWDDVEGVWETFFPSFDYDVYDYGFFLYALSQSNDHKIMINSYMESKSKGSR